MSWLTPEQREFHKKIRNYIANRSQAEKDEEFKKFGERYRKNHSDTRSNEDIMKKMNELFPIPNNEEEMELLRKNVEAKIEEYSA